eukprot:jgi/Ulvmu1/11343/UM075_0003.1
MSDARQKVTDLPDARRCPHAIRPLDSEPANLLQTRPFVINPVFPSAQLELTIYPQENVPIHTLNFEANLNTFNVGRDESDALTFPYHGFQSVGERAPGFKLATDNSPSARAERGESVRVCWTIDFADIPKSIAAVAFSLSITPIQSIRALVLSLHSAAPDSTSSRHTRERHLGEMRVPAALLQERSSGHQGGTCVLAVLARSDAWWHIHGMLSFSPPATGKTFAEQICQQPQKGGPAPLWPLLSGVNTVSPLGYTDFRTISASVSAVRNLPVTSTLERLTCGLASTHAQPALQFVGPATRPRKPVKGLLKRAARSGTCTWTDVECSVGRVCAPRVAASDPCSVLVTLRCGRASAIKADDSDPGVLGDGISALRTVQTVEVPLARLWRLMPRGEHVVKRLLEVKLRPPATAPRPVPPITATLEVEVTQDPWPFAC